MSRKQNIYCEMLQWAIPHVRNIQTHSALQKAFDKTCYHEAGLVHNLYASILEEEFIEHDIWFLNVQARYYYENAEKSKTPCYEAQCKLIKELFDSVPSHMRKKLEWEGPQF